MRFAPLCADSPAGDSVGVGTAKDAIFWTKTWKPLELGVYVPFLRRYDARDRGSERLLLLCAGRG